MRVLTMVLLTGHISNRVAGDVVYLNVAGQPTIILNSQQAASDLLDRRAASYSGRPHFAVRNELMCGGMFLPFQTHNDKCA